MRTSNNAHRKRIIISFFLTPLYLIGLFIINQIKIDFYDSNRIFTLTLTNIGFALFLALANVSFSWARSFGEDQYNSASRINKIAVLCLYNALLLIATSFLTYVISKQFITQEQQETGGYYLVNSARIVLLTIMMSSSLIIMVKFIKIGYKLYIAPLWFKSSDRVT